MVWSKSPEKSKKSLQSAELRRMVAFLFKKTKIIVRNCEIFGKNSGTNSGTLRGFRVVIVNLAGTREGRMNICDEGEMGSEPLAGLSLDSRL